MQKQNEIVAQEQKLRFKKISIRNFKKNCFIIFFKFFIDQKFMLYLEQNMVISAERAIIC